MAAIARQLGTMRGVADTSAAVFSAELFGPHTFQDDRQVGAVMGVAPVPYRNDQRVPDQGISRAGRPESRRIALPLAWGWRRAVTVEELRTRLREGKIYRPEKVEQALSNFFRKGNLSTLRELVLRAVADEVGEKAASYREREGLEPALIPERVMVCMSSNAAAPRVIRTGARIAGRLLSSK